MLRVTSSICTIFVGAMCVVKAWTLGPSSDLSVLYTGVGMALFAIISRSAPAKE